MNSSPLISVIVPVYNVDKFLKKCVKSISHQTYENLEIILVDDGSTDRSGEMCDEFAKKDNRIKVIHKENGGLSSARNAGLKEISGEYISFIDSDDFIDNSYIENMVNTIKNDGSDLAISGYTSCDEDGNVLGVFKSQSIGLINREKFWDRVILGDSKDIIYGAVEACLKLYKAELFNYLSFPEIIHEDEAILYDIINRSSFISVTDIAGYYYTQRKGSITHKEFTVEKMRAAASVFIDRSEKFFAEGHQKYAECTLMTGASNIIDGIRRISDDTPGKKEALQDLMYRYRKTGEMIRRRTVSSRFFIKSLLFSISPRIYASLCRQI